MKICFYFWENLLKICCFNLTFSFSFLFFKENYLCSICLKFTSLLEVDESLLSTLPFSFSLFIFLSLSLTFFSLSPLSLENSLYYLSQSLYLFFSLFHDSLLFPLHFSLSLFLSILISFTTSFSVLS